MPIHPTAIIRGDVRIDPTATVGPYCFLEGDIEVGAHVELVAHVILRESVKIGANSVIHPFASIGGFPQSLGYSGPKHPVIIGENCIFREYTSVSGGTEHTTLVGDHCYVMVASHLAHDVKVGKNVTIVNHSAVAGHAVIGDFARIAGYSVVTQKVTIGRNSFIGGRSWADRDIPPFCFAKGENISLVGLNIVGLRRSGWKKSEILALRSVFLKTLHESKSRKETARELMQDIRFKSDAIQEFLNFVVDSKQGVPPCDLSEVNPSEGERSDAEVIPLRKVA